MVPPAASILARAAPLNLAAAIFSGDSSSPSARICERAAVRVRW